MCAFSEEQNYSFKWITYLVVIIGIYTFIHWFLATPLLHSHFYDCCNEKWHKNWIICFLVSSFAIWCLSTLIIFIIWIFCRRCLGTRLNESEFPLTETKKEKQLNDGGVTKEKISNGQKSEDKFKNSNNLLKLPEFNSNNNLTVVKMTENGHDENGMLPKVDCPIPVSESQHYIQTEIPEDKTCQTPVKTPREIFFKDMIEAANMARKNDLYFDFDPEKITENIKKKYEKLKKRDKGTHVCVINERCDYTFYAPLTHLRTN